MRRITSSVLFILAVAAGCSTATAPPQAANASAPLCEFSGLTPQSPEWSACMSTMAVNPDRDLLAAVIKARAEAEASGVPDVRAEMARRTKAIFEESVRRARVREAQAASSGTADCGAWHWDSIKVACQP